MIEVEKVDAYLRGLQDALCAAFERADGKARFAEDCWERPAGGGGRSRAFADGRVFEKIGVNYSRVAGDRLPAAASAARPELADRRFEAMGVSVVAHPDNPYVPTAHCNVRFFVAPEARGADGETPLWWFGGGFDLTPCYPFAEDARAWHRAARDICQPFGADVYARCKRRCDEYFFLAHRGETRGVGGLFFDDLNAWGFADTFRFARGVGDGFAAAYLAIVEKRRSLPFGEREKRFQALRRGRYVEFNLLYDRGTLFGLQSGGRTESILMSLPPRADWAYAWQPAPGGAEEDLLQNYLRPRAWLDEAESDASA